MAKFNVSLDYGYAGSNQEIRGWWSLLSYLVRVLVPGLWGQDLPSEIRINRRWEGACSPGKP